MIPNDNLDQFMEPQVTTGFRFPAKLMRRLSAFLVALFWLWSAGFVAAAAGSLVAGLLAFAAFPLLLVLVPSPRRRAVVSVFGALAGVALALFLVRRPSNDRDWEADQAVLRGLYRNYEIMYVIGDERDLIALRTNCRGDSLYLYPTNATPERAREIFLDVLRAADELRERPVFYNTVSNNCSSVIRDHINRFAKDKVPFDFRVLFPARADEILAEDQPRSILRG